MYKVDLNCKLLINLYIGIYMYIYTHMYIHVYIPTHTYMASVLISTHPNKHILANCSQRPPHLLLFPYNFPFDSFPRPTA